MFSTIRHILRSAAYVAHSPGASSCISAESRGSARERMFIPLPHCVSEKLFVLNIKRSIVCAHYNDKFTLNPMLIYEVSVEELAEIIEHRCLFSAHSTHVYRSRNINTMKLDVIFSWYSTLCTSDPSRALFIGVVLNLINLKQGKCPRRKNAVANAIFSENTHPMVI